MNRRNIKSFIIITCIVSGLGILLALFRINGFTAKTGGLDLRVNSSKHLPTSLNASLVIPSNLNMITSPVPSSRLKKACRHVKMAESAHQHWPETVYYTVAESNLMYCPLKGVKTEFWKYFVRLLTKERKRKGRSTRLKDNTVYFSDEHVKNLKLIVMCINPYTWLLHGFVEKLLLGMDICKPTSLQRFIDKVISGVKLRINQGLNFTPIIPLCRPCEVNIHSVVRYENFDSDVATLLDSVGTSKVKLTSLGYDFGTAIRDDVSDLTSIALRQYRSHHCTNTTDLGLRLLEALRLRGYIIPDTLKRYLSKLASSNIKALESKVLQSSREISMVSSDVHTALLHDEYSNVRKEAIEYVQSIYQFEFEAFGYSNNP